MSFQLNVGNSVNINASVGVDSDYTFTSSSPDRATVDANGVVTGISGGLVVIRVVRNSDSALISNLLMRIQDESVVESEVTFTVEAYSPPAGLSVTAVIEEDLTVTLSATWTNLSWAEETGWLFGADRIVFKSSEQGATYNGVAHLSVGEREANRGPETLATFADVTEFQAFLDLYWPSVAGAGPYEFEILIANHDESDIGAVQASSVLTFPS